MAAGSALDRTLTVIAALACLFFGFGLSDTRLHRVQPERAAPPPPAAVMARSGRLDVVVLDVADCAEPKTCAGVPLQGADVRLFWEHGGVYYDAGAGKTDARGVAEFQRLPEGATVVIADAPGKTRRSTRLVVDESTRRSELRLGRAAELVVTAREDTGAPIARATVLVTTAEPLPFGALTAEDGAARIGRLDAPPWVVKVSAPGFESIERSGVSGDVTLTLRRLGAIDVLVQGPDGKPVPDATVHIAGALLWPARRAQTDARGATLISGLLGGSYELRASKGELVSQTLLAVDLERGARESITLKLVPGRMVSVLVTDGDGDNPVVVPNADVVLVEDGLSAFPLRGRTGTDGTVRLGPISPGPASVSARAPEFVARGAVPVPEPLNGPVRVALVRGGSIEGRVVDSRDFPVDGASIEVVGSDMYGLPVAETPALMSFRSLNFQQSLAGPQPLIPAGELGVMPGPIPLVSQAMRGAGTTPAPWTREPAFAPDVIDPWVTRADGTFLARPVTPGRLRVLVRHPSYVEGLSDLVTVTSGGTATVKVVLRTGGTLEGRVVDERGRYVAGARVDLSAKLGSFDRTTQTADDGSFAFAAVPEDVAVSVSRPEQFGRVALRRALVVPEGKRTQVELVLPALRDAIEIAIQDQRGDPVDGAQVTLLSLDPNAPLRRTLFTGQSGELGFDDARGLRLDVLVEAAGFARARRVFDAAPAEIVVKLLRGLRVEGRVTARNGRDAVAGASVTLIADGVRKSALTDQDGRYAIADVATGAARVQVAHPSYAETHQEVEIADTGRADRPFEVPAIDLYEAGSAEGEVLDGAGKPVLGARVAVDMAPAFLPAGALPPGMGVTAADGRFTLHGVRAGPVTLEAYAPGVGRGTANVNVVAGRVTSRVRIVLTQQDTEPEVTASGSVAVTLGERGSGDDLEIVIVHVAAGSDAERSGLRPGDVLAEIDGVMPENMADARARLSGSAGSDVVVEIDRGPTTLRLRVAREPVRR